MRLTANYSLKKPEGSDVVNIDDINYNTDIIDTKIKSVEDNISSLGTRVSTVENKINGLSLTAKSISVADSSNLFTATNVEDVLSEIMKEVTTNKSTLQTNITGIREVL